MFAAYCALCELTYAASQPHKCQSPLEDMERRLALAKVEIKDLEAKLAREQERRVVAETRVLELEKKGR